MFDWSLFSTNIYICLKNNRCDLCDVMDITFNLISVMRLGGNLSYSSISYVFSDITLQFLYLLQVCMYSFESDKKVSLVGFLASCLTHLACVSDRLRSNFFLTFSLECFLAFPFLIWSLEEDTSLSCTFDKEDFWNKSR